MLARYEARRRCSYLYRCLLKKSGAAHSLTHGLTKFRISGSGSGPGPGFSP